MEYSQALLKDDLGIVQFPTKYSTSSCIGKWTVSQRMLFLLYFEQSAHLHSILNSSDINKKIVINIWRMRSNLSKVCGDWTICRQEYLMTDVEKRGLKSKTDESCPWEFNVHCTKSYWNFYRSLKPNSCKQTKPKKQSSKPKPSLIICMFLLTLSIPVHMHVEISQLNFSKWKFCSKNLKNDIVLTWKSLSS